MLAIINADLRTCGPRGDLRHATVLVADGKIVAVGENLAIPADATRIDARGLCVTPGFIDAHTHMGMGWQELAGEADANESTSVVNAHLRAIDAINLNDVAFDDALEGGVTTLMILPGKLMIGAQNISPVAGQAVVMKARGDVRAVKCCVTPPA
ncbi:MAG: amidohydrolase family protein [Anaerolineales bacterium]|nr:amidohydrolase family protein [Anaerolineales bacterium]